MNILIWIIKNGVGEIGYFPVSETSQRNERKKPRVSWERKRQMHIKMYDNSVFHRAYCITFKIKNPQELACLRNSRTNKKASVEC